MELADAGKTVSSMEVLEVESAGLERLFFSCGTEGGTDAAAMAGMFFYRFRAEFTLPCS